MHHKCKSKDRNHRVRHYNNVINLFHQCKPHTNDDAYLIFLIYPTIMRNWY